MNFSANLSETPPASHHSLSGTAIGIDIGGTKISSGLVNEDQGLHHFQQHPTPDEAEPFLATLATMVQTLSKLTEGPEPLAGIGIATAGIVDPKRGMILGATGNLPAVRGIPSLKEALEARTGLPVYVENDANAAAYGETRGGAAKGAASVLMITLGTGVGTGIIIDGKILHGAHFSAGEGGHIFIAQHQERLCTCGRWNCWEAYASGTGVRETAHRLLHATPNAEHSQIMVNRRAIEEVTTHDVIAAWKSGDPLAQEILNAWHQHIAIGLGGLINVLDPEVVVVGGGMAQFVDFEKLRMLTQERSMPQGIRLVPAQLGNQAGIVGAAYLALEHCASSTKA
jgi:glucokinase